MASLGDLVVNLVADSSRMSKGLKEAETQLTAFAAAATAMAAASVTRFLQVGSAFDDMAQRTGVSVEALSSLSWAAKLSDTTIESLQGSLFKMAKFMADVRSQSASAEKALADLGLSSSMVLAASPDQQFMLFADAIASIEDPSARAAAAMEIFGKGAAEILPLLQQGSAGIQAMQQEARDLGLVMSGETAQSAAETADAIDRLFAAVDATGQKIGAFFAPVLQASGNAMAFLIGKSQSLVTVLGAAAAAAGVAMLAMKALALTTQAYAKAQAIATALSGPKGMLVLAAALGAATYAGAVLTEQFREQNRELANVEEQAKRTGDAVQTAMKPKQTARPFERELTSMADLQKAFNDLKTSSAESQIENFRGRMKDLGYQFESLSKFSSEPFSRSDFERYRQSMIDGFSGVGEAAKKLQDELEILRGETTLQERAYADMVAKGASNAQIDALRTMQAERDKLLKQQGEEEERQKRLAAQDAEREAMARARVDAAKAEADAIVEGLKTPDQKLQDRINKIKELQKGGFLTAEQSAQAQAQVKQEAAPLVTKQEPQFASAAMRGSSEAFSTILKSMGRKDPNVAATEKQTGQLVAALKENKVEFAVAEGA